MRTIVVAETDIVAEIAAHHFQVLGHDDIQVARLMPSPLHGRNYVFDHASLTKTMDLPSYELFRQPHDASPSRLGANGKAVIRRGFMSVDTSSLRHAELVAIFVMRSPCSNAVALQAADYFGRAAPHAKVVFHRVGLGSGVDDLVIQSELARTAVEHDANDAHVEDFLDYNFRLRARFFLKKAFEGIQGASYGGASPNLFAIHVADRVFKTGGDGILLSKTDLDRIVIAWLSSSPGHDGRLPLNERARARVVSNLKMSGLVERKGNHCLFGESAWRFRRKLHPEALDPRLPDLLGNWFRNGYRASRSEMAAYIDGWFGRQRDFEAGDEKIAA